MGDKKNRRAASRGGNRQKTRRPPKVSPPEVIDGRKFNLVVQFQFHPDGVTEDQADEELGGIAGDGAIVAVLTRDPDGVNVSLASIDGRRAPEGEKVHSLSGMEIFRIWSHIARHISDMPDVHKDRRDFCEQVHRAASVLNLEAPGGPTRTVPKDRN